MDATQMGMADCKWIVAQDGPTDGSNPRVPLAPDPSHLTGPEEMWKTVPKKTSANSEREEEVCPEQPEIKIVPLCAHDHC